MMNPPKPGIQLMSTLPSFVRTALVGAALVGATPVGAAPSGGPPATRAIS
jgi:hypothetical protein